MNIFVLTEDAVTCFDWSETLLDARRFSKGLRAACRNSGGEDLTTLWPEDLAHCEII